MTLMALLMAASSTWDKRDQTYGTQADGKLRTCLDIQAVK